MGWSDAARSVWGKTDSDAEAGEASWLPLVQHLEDSAAVAGYLWDEWLAPNVRRVISEPLPGGESDGRRLVSFLAGVHDVGKATPAFALKARHAQGPDGGFGFLIDDMVARGLRMPLETGEKLPPHCRVGHALVRDWLLQQGMPKRLANGFASPVGAHHGTPPSQSELNQLRGSPLLGDGPVWSEVQGEILDGMAARTGAVERFDAWQDVELPLTSQALITSVVVIADWLASDATRFPYEVEPGEDRLALADPGTDLMQPWHPRLPGSHEADQQFAQRFPQLAGRRPHPVQREALRLAHVMDVPALLVIEAPMGQGKTEAALASAEVLAARFGLSGVFVGLPTMATSDAMFGRVHSWINNLPDEDSRSVFLAHGKAALNKDYEQLSSARYQGVGEPDDEAKSRGAQVSPWLQGRRKGVLASMVVGTIDQALMAGLKARHVALRHLALASKVVVLDEVHAADAYMARYLDRVLEWLGAYGVPVVLLSATLPPTRRQALLAAYARGRGVEGPALDADLSYPRLTVQDDESRSLAVADSGPGRELTVEPLEDDITALRRLVSDAVDEGACVVIVRNTVRRAQETYDDLVRDVGADRIMLLHSRFIGVERMRRENVLRSLLGPPGPSVERPRGFVVVGTQVLEQSLDIDADLMVTDLAPMDLVLQRAGRMHRHQRGPDESERPVSVRRPRLLVTGFVQGDRSVPPDLERGATAIYGEALLLRAAAVLRPHLDGQPLQIPEDIPRLVAAAYDPDARAPEGWETRWLEAECLARRAVDERERNADGFRLDDPFYKSHLIGWLEGRVDDVGDEVGVAAVRDGEDGLEVVVVQRDGADVRVLDGTGEFAGQLLPDVSFDPPPTPIARALAGHTLRLPASLTRWGRADSFIQALEDLGRDFMGWQASPWLQGQLVLPLDGGGDIEILDSFLHYDHELGLTVQSQ